MNTKKLSLVTVSYGNPKRLSDLCESIKHCVSEIDFEWIVVENWSTQEHQEHAQKIVDSLPEGHMIPLAQNIGFGAANNVGAKFATGEYVFFVNPDICLKKGCIEPLIDHLTHHHHDLVAPKIETKDGKRLENARTFPSMWRLFVRRAFHVRDSITPEIKTHVPWVQGSFLGMRKDCFEALKGFDERFFLFLEDTDLCRRVWNHGGKVVIDPASIVTHEEERLSGNTLLPSMIKKTFWIHLKSACVYFWKWRGKKMKDLSLK